MNKYWVYISFLWWAMATISCTYHVEEELYPPDSCDTMNVTYSGTVLPIIQLNCYECHDNAHVVISQILLEGYSNLIIKVNDGKLISAIRHDGTASFMPKDRPSLAECDILKIEKWVAEGAPDN